jgi:hypothetical protein
MSEENWQAGPLELGEIQAVSDLKLGVRSRRGWAKSIVLAKQHGISEQQWRGFVTGGGLNGTDDTKKTLAATLGIDWNNLLAFLQALAPIIIQMMAACGA